MFYGKYIKSNIIEPLDSDTFGRLIEAPTLAGLDWEVSALYDALARGTKTKEEIEERIIENKKKRPYICTSDFEPDKERFVRSNKLAKWSGLASLDIDHIDASLSEERAVRSEELITPISLYESRIKGHEAEWGIVAVFISPSQHGLKIIFRIGKNVDIAAAQGALAELIGTKFDACTKDPARCTFLVSKNQWLYLDLEGMFTKTPEEFSLVSSEKRVVSSEPTATKASSGEAPLLTTHSSLLTYNGFPMKTIVEEWWEQHGTPEIGSRHAAIYQLAYNLKFICENDPQMTFEAIKTHDTFGKPDDEVLAICKDACEKRADHLYMPKELKAVINSLKPLSNSPQRGENGSRTDGDGNEDSTDEHRASHPLPLGEGWGGASLPLGIRDSLENVAPAMQMPVLVSLLPLMGAYADGVKARYADGRLHPLALMSIVVGEMASGKSECKDIADVWLEKMREDDAEQRRIEDEWKQANKGRKANEKGKPDPQVVIRELPITTSCSTLLKRLKNSQGHTLYSFDEELDTLHKTNSAGNWSAKYDIYRKAFDNSMWGQDYNSDQATSGMAKVAYNFTILGTYGSFRKCFKGESVENGLASRIIIAEMPDNKYAKLQARKLLSDEQQANIRKAVDILSSAEGDLDLPKLRYMMEEWVEDKRIEALKNADDLKDAFRKRAAVIGFRAGVLFYLLETPQAPRTGGCGSPQGAKLPTETLNGNQRGKQSTNGQQQETNGQREEANGQQQEANGQRESHSSPKGRAEAPRSGGWGVSDSCCRFAQLVAQYTLDEQMRMFGEQFLHANEENEKCQYGTNNQELLDTLPKKFTIKDVQKLRGASTSNKVIYRIVTRWIDNDIVAKVDAHTWTKI